MRQWIVLALILGILSSCGGKGGGVVSSNTEINNGQGSIETPTVTPVFAPDPSPIHPVNNSNLPNFAIPPGPSPLINWLPVGNEQLLITSGYPAKVGGMWRGPCSIYFNGKISSQCYLELNLIQSSGKICPEVIEITPNLVEAKIGSFFSTYLTLKNSLATSVTGRMGMIKNNLMTEANCDLATSYPQSGSKNWLGTIGQGGFLFKGFQGMNQLKLVVINGGIEIEYKNGPYILYALLQ